jgi:hypothetical protein
MLCLLSFQISFAQETITVKGTVKDANAQPNPGATVTEKGKTNAVVTDNNGNYQIKVSKDAILVF